MRKILDSCFQLIVSFENLVLRIYRARAEWSEYASVFVRGEREKNRMGDGEELSVSECVLVCFWHRVAH